MDLTKIIEEIRASVASNYNNFKGIYLYGSRAKGLAKEDSDIDVVILFDSELTNDEELKLAGLIGDIEYKYDVFIDSHPYTMTALERNPFYYESVVEEGIYFGKEAA